MVRAGLRTVCLMRLLNVSWVKPEGNVLLVLLLEK